MTGSPEKRIPSCSYAYQELNQHNYRNHPWTTLKTQVILSHLIFISSVTRLHSPLAKRATTFTYRDETETVSLLDGDYTTYQAGYLAGTWELFGTGQYVTLAGTGYIRCRWEVEYWKGSGSIVYPTFTNQSDTFLCVAGGGGYAQSDTPPPCYDSDDVCSNYTGSTNYGYSWFLPLGIPTTTDMIIWMARSLLRTTNLPVITTWVWRQLVICIAPKIIIRDFSLI